MSKQLALSASLSVLAMLGLAVIASPAAAEELNLAGSPFHAVASACASASAGMSELLPMLQPGLQ